MKHSKDGQVLLSAMEKDIKKKRMMDRAKNIEGGEKILEGL